MRNKLFRMLSIILASALVLVAVVILLLPAGLRWGGEKWLRDQGLEAAVEAVDLDLSEGWAMIRGVAAKAPGGAGLGLRQLRITWRWSPLWEDELRIAGIEVEGLYLDAERRSDGQLTIGGIVLPDAGSPETPSAQAPGVSPWRYTLGDVSLSDLRLCYRDETLSEHANPAARRFGETCTRWDTLEWRGEAAIGPQPEVATQPLPWQISGTLDWRGLAVTAAENDELRVGFRTLSVRKLQLQGSDAIQAQQIAIEGLRVADPLQEAHLGDWITFESLEIDQPVVSNLDTIRIASIQLDALQVLQTRGAQTGQLMAGLEHLELETLEVEQLRRSRQLSIRAAAAQGLSALKRQNPAAETASHIAVFKAIDVENLSMPDPATLNITKLRITAPEVWLSRTKEGNWELVEWLAPEGGAPAETGQQEALKFTIGELHLDGNGSVTFDDQMVSPPYRETVKEIAMTIGGVDNTAPEQPSPAQIEAAVGRYGKLALTGEVKPFAEKPDLNLTGSLHGIDLGPTTSYARDAVQHHVRQGSLDAELAIKIDNGVLDTTVKLELHKLELDPLSKEEIAADAEKELGIPLNAALSLLRDKDDAIRLELPIEGDLQSPDVSVRNVLGKVMGKALKTAIVAYYSPFGLLKLAGAVLDLATGLSFEPVPFAPGDAALTSEARKPLAEIARLLRERPQVRLALCGDVTRADFDQLYPPPPPPPAKPAMTAPQSGVTATLNSDAKEPVTTQPPVEPAPRTPTVEQAKALWELASRRGEAVKDFLVKETGVEAKRLILCNPKQVLKEEMPAVVKISI